ncbi:MAG: 23S rRNA (uracil(1939)-C(5))-methyltransferase RlmD [Bacteroidales bacterium]|nr:23S rRNA (uracil(1939)-C(5))-methyltransferase RlmD [Bacteroidales bacterium]
MQRKQKPNIIINNLLITDAGSEGVCIGKYEDRIIFVPYVVPGDVVDVKVIKKKKSYYRAVVIAVHTYSLDRVISRCKYFEMCGGCKWQNMNYERQLHYKRKQVIDNFQHIGKFEFPEVNPIISSELIFAYRNKMEYTFSNKRWLYESEMQDVDAGLVDTNGLGFHFPSMFNKILDIHHCDLHDELGNDIRNSVRKYAIDKKISFCNLRTQSGLLRNLIIRTSSTGDVMVILVVTEFNQEVEGLLSFLKQKFPQITSLMYVKNIKMNSSMTDLVAEGYSGNDFLMEEVGDLKFKIAPLAFYQTNSKQAVKLYEAVLRLADVKKTHTVYDLYTGAGTIALCMAKYAKKVIGIEYIESAVEAAHENATLNHIENAHFFAGDMVDILTDEFVALNGLPDIIVTDPPRAGMHPKVVSQLLKIMPQRIVYVSCNPATQARDIALLAHKYVVKEVQPVDMFPHTHHVENIAVLIKRSQD